MPLRRKRGPQRFILVAIIVIAGAWLLGFFGAPQREGISLAANQVTLQVQNQTGRFSASGNLQGGDVSFVYVNALRRVTLDNKNSLTSVVESRKVAVKDGKFTTEFLGFNNTTWLEALKKQFASAKSIQPDGVIEIALSGFQLKTPVARDTIVKSVFLNYQPQH